jgi:hypothetical protein
LRFVTIKGDVIHAYLSYNITASPPPPPKDLTCNASLKEMRGKTTSIIYSINYTNKEILRSGNNVNNINEQVCKS